MAVIAVLIGCSFMIAVGFLAAFLWAVKNGQYEDKYTPSVRMLLDGEINKTGQTFAEASLRDLSVKNNMLSDKNV
jgi:cbb3-type cytochrome oxidase maturation protein